MQNSWTRSPQLVLLTVPPLIFLNCLSVRFFFPLLSLESTVCCVLGMFLTWSRDIFVFSADTSQSSCLLLFHTLSLFALGGRLFHWNPRYYHFNFRFNSHVVTVWGTASSGVSAVTVNFARSAPEASDSTLDYVRRLNYQGMLQLFQRSGESDLSGGKQRWGCDKKQMLPNDNNVKQAAGDICQHSGVEELQIAPGRR